MKNRYHEQLSLFDIGKVEQIEEPDLFKFLHAFFGDKKKYEKISDDSKEGHKYMLFHLLAVLFPVRIYQLNGYESIVIMDDFHKQLCKNGHGIPREITTFLSKSRKEVHPIEAYPIKVRQAYYRGQKGDVSNLKDQWNLFPSATKKRLDHIKDAYDEQSKVKKNGSKSRLKRVKK